MISLSCVESSSSSCAMRAAIMASVSFETRIWSRMISPRKAFTHSFPCFLSSSLWPSRPSCTILSRRLDSTAYSVVACEVDCCCGSAGILAFLFRFFGAFQLTLVRGFVLRDRLVQQRLQLVVPVQAAAQVRQFGAQFQQLVQRRHLARHLIGL